MRRIRPHHAFTLVELLVVMAVVGVLAAIGIPRYRSAQQRTYLAVMQSDLRAIRTAEEMYLADHGQYALSIDSLPMHPSDGVGLVLSSSDPGTSWRAVAVHAYSDQSCETGEGADAPPGAAGEIPCGEPGALGRGSHSE